MTPYERVNPLFVESLGEDIGSPHPPTRGRVLETLGAPAAERSPIARPMSFERFDLARV